MDTIDEVVSVFTQLSNQSLTRIRRGAQLRAEMQTALREGKRPQGYRADWLRAAAALMIDTLGKIAITFDEEHPDDRCSLADMMDITATTMGLLKRESGGDDDED